jgi:DNA-binding MarR family transcriptional regulator
MDKDALRAVCSTLSAYKLPATHTMVLLMVNEREVSMQDISKSGGFTTANATGIVDTMEAKGYVERYHSTEDRRKVMVKISEPGIVVIDNILRHIKDL